MLADPEAAVLATARGGVPLVVEKAAGQGRSIVFAFPADNAWGEWAIHRLYVPLVHQLLGYLTNRLPETSPVRFEAPAKVRRELPALPSITAAR